MTTDRNQRTVGGLLREAVTRTLFAGRLRRMERMMELMEDAYRRGPGILPPELLVKRLMEVDPRFIDMIMRQRGYRLLSPAGKLEFGEQDRKRAIEASRYHYHYDLQLAHAVDMWTDFGFGQRVQVVPRDEAAAEVWDEFWTAPRNAPILKQRRLHRLSNKLLIDGELFLVVYASTQDGTCRLRTVPSDQITSIVYESGDNDVPLFYVREGDFVDANGLTTRKVLYYPDWQADSKALDEVTIPQGVERVDKMKPDTLKRPGTDVRTIYVAVSDVSGRGWPAFRRVIEWSAAYRDFLQDRAAVARAVAMYVDKLKYSGGSRAGEAMRDRLGSTIQQNLEYFERNPPPVAGSTFIENEAVTRTRMPLSTAAGDARYDGLTLLGQVSAGTGSPLHWMGRPDAMQNQAVARETERPWTEQLQRYQQLWADVFQDLVNVVLGFSERYGGKTFETTEADITLETPLGVLVEEVTMLMDATTAAAQAGTLDYDVALNMQERLVSMGLETLGVRDPAAVLRPPEDEEGDGEEGAAPTLPERPVAEAVDPETGKVKPRGRPMAKQGRGRVPISPQDVADAVKHWDASMPAAFSGLLSAEPAEESEGE